MSNRLKAVFLKPKHAMSKWINGALQGTRNHFSCYLPENIGWFLSLLFNNLFSGIVINENEVRKIRELPENAIIIYATKHKSLFEFLFFHTRYRRLGIPQPVIGFDHKMYFLQPVSRVFRMILAHAAFFIKRHEIPNPYEEGYISEELESGKAALLSLIDEKGFYLRFVKEDTDPIHYLLELQKTREAPIYIVPQLVFFGKRPIRSTPTLTDIIFGSEEKPRSLRKMFTLLKNPGKIFAEVSEPILLSDFLKESGHAALEAEKLSLQLRRRLIVQINKHRQTITGPILKTREELKENILTHDRLRKYIRNYSESHNVPINKAHKEADAYIDEIAAKYSMGMIRLFSLFVNWLIKMMFDGFTLNTEVLAKVKTMSRKGPLILAPCHKSHIDYLILSFVMYHNNMPCPLIAAGKNLSFWPLGPIFRGGGAFFIRRTFKGAALYGRVFSEYVYKMLEEGFNIEFFIEGGRSRTGKLIQPKFGMLSIILNAFQEGACEDLIFVPVYIGYDRVVEESAYLHELGGGQKRPEDLGQVIKARKAVRKRYGKIYIQFHDPLSLNELMAQRGLSLATMTEKESRTLCRYLGYKILNSIDSVSIVTPHAIVAGAILNCPKPRFKYKTIMEHIETYMNFLNSQDAKLSDTLLVDYIHAVQYVIDVYEQRRFIERVSKEKGQPEDESIFMINMSRRPGLEYYKNNGIIYFVPAAFTAMAILEKDAFQFSVTGLLGSYTFLQNFFINEFAYDTDRTPEFYLRKNIKSFTGEAMLIPHPTLSDTYNLTSAGFRKLRLFASFLKTYFESYWVVLNVFMRYPSNFTDAKGRLKKIQSMGQRMIKRKEIERQEALSRMNYKNAVDFFIQNGVRGAEDTEKIEYYADVIQKYLSHLSQ